MKVLEQLMTKTMTNTYVVIFFCRLHFSLAVIVPDIYIYRVHWLLLIIIVLFVETPRKFINKINKFNCNNKCTWCFRKQNYYKLLQICSQAVDKLCSHCLFPVVVTSLMTLSEMLHSCSNKSDTVMI